MRLVAVMVAAATLTGFAATYFIGAAIRNELKNLSFLEEEKRTLIAESRELTMKRDQLLDPKRIEEKAAILGLYPPTTEQIRRP